MIILDTSGSVEEDYVKEREMALRLIETINPESFRCGIWYKEKYHAGFVATALVSQWLRCASIRPPTSSSSSTIVVVDNKYSTESPPSNTPVIWLLCHRMTSFK